MKDRKIRIAIVRLSALGDIINTAIALQIIKKYLPHSHIDWFCDEAFASILQNHPLLDNTIAIPLKKLKKERSIKLLIETIKTIRSYERYDIVIDAQGLLKSAIVTALIRGKTHGFDKHSIREKIASLFYSTTTNIDYGENIIKRNIKVICEGSNIPFDIADIENKSPIFETKSRPSVMGSEKNISIIIGASWQSKCYSDENFIELINMLPHRCFIIWGSSDEKSRAEHIISKAKNATLAPQMNLAELVNFIAHSDLVIGNDTGPTHMAWAMNRASITLFGPTNERMIYPTHKNLFIKSPSSVNIYKIDKNDFSINEIKPSQIAEMAGKLLD